MTAPATSEAERLLARLATPVAKYWACKRAPPFVAEALECHGGNGFVEDHLLARLYREAPLNGIWEGTGNVVCLDVVRTLRREPEAAGVFLDELRSAGGVDPRFDSFVTELARRLADLPQAEAQARRTVEMMALALQASLLLRHSTPAAGGCVLRYPSRRRLGSRVRHSRGRAWMSARSSIACASMPSLRLTSAADAPLVDWWRRLATDTPCIGCPVAVVLNLPLSGSRHYR